MTVFIWMNENGEWRVTHLPPTDGSTYVRAILADAGSVVFFGEDNQEIEVKVR